MRNEVALLAWCRLVSALSEEAFKGLNLLRSHGLLAHGPVDIAAGDEEDGQQPSGLQGMGKTRHAHSPDQSNNSLCTCRRFYPLITSELKCGTMREMFLLASKTLFHPPLALFSYFSRGPARVPGPLHLPAVISVSAQRYLPARVVPFGSRSSRRRLPTSHARCSQRAHQRRGRGRPATWPASDVCLNRGCSMRKRNGSQVDTGTPESDGPRSRSTVSTGVSHA